MGMRMVMDWKISREVVRTSYRYFDGVFSMMQVAY